MNTVLSLVLLLTGLVLAFAGWQLYEALIHLFGALLGGSMAYVLGLHLADGSGLTDAGVIIGAALAVLGGAAGAYTAAVAHRAMYVFTGFGLGSLLGLVLQDNLAIAVVIGLVAGYAAWVVHKLTVIALTALVGGGFVSLAASGATSGAALLLIAGGVAVAGGAVQVEVFGTDLATTTGSDSLRQACPGCGHPCAAGDRYCQGCGQALNWCPSCGHIADGSWEFCEGCGTELPAEF